METSLAEDVQKPIRTLSPDSFFFMSPYRSFSTSGCFRRLSAPAVGGDALNGEFQQQMAAAFAEARATKGQPTAIIAETTKGKGVSFMENQVGWHGKAPNDEQFEQAMAELAAAGEEL